MVCVCVCVCVCIEVVATATPVAAADSEVLAGVAASDAAGRHLAFCNFASG